jgi:NAD(P)-dependent dehydrogenase (short-subunit alcohol dehydrogenase family)
MRLDFTGRTAVVTGGANGIGYAIAEVLSQCGALVWILDLEQERPDEVAARLGGQGCIVDVTDRDSIDAAFEKVGRVDVLAANAGTAAPSGITEASREHWDRTLAINLTGMFYSVQTAARRMKQQRSGAIVLTASTNSFDGEADLTAYNASKAGALGILHTAANELGPYGIRVNAVCPGLIRTRLTARYFDMPEVVRPYFQQIAMGRGGEPEEVARAVAFLASDLASFITGATLLVDGGQMAAKFGTWNDETATFVKDHWELR